MLQELANPYVANNLEFYPHDPHGKNIHSLCQSKKWREELSPEHRVQMVVVLEKHFYIFEPVMLKGADCRIVVPIFFYKQNQTIIAKSIVPKFHSNPNSVGCSILIPSNIDYNSNILVDIHVTDFHLMCSEIKSRDGTWLLQACGAKLVGV